MSSKRSADWMSCQIRCSKYEAVWLRVPLPLTHSRFMSVYRWRRGLHLACSGCKSCACVTVLRPRMWTDFLLWHLIWLTWHQQAAVDSHNCHLVTEQRNRNRKRRKRLSSRGRAERMGTWKKTRQRREVYTELETFGREEKKTYKEKESSSFFSGFGRLTTLFLSYKHASEETMPVWFGSSIV